MPLKRPFGFPVTAEALKYFVHPGGEPELERPFSIGGVVHASNGFLTVRMLNGAGLSAPEVTAATMRLAGLPWGHLEALDDKDPCWVGLDDVAGTLWRYGPVPIWERTHLRYHLRTLPAVTVGVAAVVTLPLLQLLARLPRCRVWVDNYLEKPLFVRWNGGDAMVVPLPDYVRVRRLPDFSILRPRRDAVTGSFEFPPAMTSPAKGPSPRPLIAGQKPWPPPEPCDD